MTKRALGGLIVLALIVVVIAGWVARVDRFAFGAIVRIACGCDLSFSKLSYVEGGFALEDAKIVSSDKRNVLTAPHVAGTFDFGAWRSSDAAKPALTLALRTPELTVERDQPKLAGLFSDARELPGTPLFQHRFAARIDRGTLALTRTGSTQAVLTLARITGALRSDGKHVTYDLDLALLDGGDVHPLHASGKASGTGVAHLWSAKRLPLAPLAALTLSPDDFEAQAGTLNDVAVRYTSSASAEPVPASALRATARLDAADFTFGTHHHSVRDLHGALAADALGIGTPLLLGTIDTKPLDVTGEIEDLHHPLAWVAEGSSDLRAFVRLADAAAAEADLDKLHLEGAAPGVAFAQYTMNGPRGLVRVNVANVDSHEPTIRFDTALAENHVISGGERTSAMAVRTGAILGLNGDYYDIGRSWEPQGLLIKSGTLVHMPTQRMAMTVHRDNTITFDEYRFSGQVRTAKATFPITMFNVWPPRETALITPDYGTMRSAAGVTVAELSPVNGKSGQFKVTHVGPAQAGIPRSMLLGFGPEVRGPIPKAGDRIDVTWQTTPASDDAVAAIGGGPLLVKDGAWFEDPHAPAPDERDVRWPVDGVGKAADGTILMFAVDGRHPEVSIGMSRPELGALMQRYGVIEAMALDSGGSVTMVARAPGDEKATVRNRPSDNDGERWVADGFFAYSSAPPLSLLETLKPAGSRSPVPEPSAKATRPP